jgi:hypothetical protein
MDIHDRVMGDKPQGFLHKIAGIVPGFNGYMDRERRRDADKLLRTYLAHQYSTQRDRLNRAEQSLLRAGQITGISEVDRLVGVFQRFIDRLNTATYGYSGMFDPVKVEAQDLDQLYTFDMALTTGVDEVSSAIGALESAITAETARTDVPAALSNLSSVLDELNLRLNQRSDLLTTGRGLPTDQYNSLVNSLGSGGGTGMPAGAPPPMAPPPPPPSAPPAPYTGAPPQYASGTPNMGAPTVNTSAGEMARYPGGYSGGTDQGNMATPPPTPAYPSGSYTGGTSGTSGTGTSDLTGGTPDYGINTASSPSSSPTAQSGAAGIESDTPSSGAIDSSTDATSLPESPSDKPQP